MSDLVFNAGEPFSFDPIDYDYKVHHMTHRPVLSTLVSQHKAGDFIGVLASGWKISADKKVWTFNIRHNLLFGNGDPITGHIIKQSMTRAAFLMKQKGSNSGLFEHILGFDDFSLEKNNLRGVSATDDSITLSFVRQPEKLLEKLSFGLYAISHPHDYNSVSGAWSDPHHAIASGAYEIVSWDEEGISLNLRSGFPIEEIYGNRRPFKSVRFAWQSNISYDVQYGTKFEPPSEQYTFFGGLMNRIVFFRLLGHSDLNSPFHNETYRKALRTELYRQLDEEKIETVKSFLPTTVQGVSEISLGKEALEPASTKFEYHVKLCEFTSKSGIKKRVLEALIESIKNLGGTAEIVKAEIPEVGKMMNPEAKETKCDGVIITTGVLVEDPWGDLRFMVNSKEGIQLPDPNREIRSLVSHTTFDLQEFNKFVWDTSLVWPLFHTAAGLWVKEEKVNMSQVYLGVPPTELALIESKD